MTFSERLTAILGPGRVRADVPLAPLTTFKVGGPADWLVDVRRGDEVRQALSVARSEGIATTVVGGGSNLLVSDRGVRGLVIRIHGGHVERIAPDRVRADAGVTINGLVRWTVSRGLSGLEHWAGTPGTVGGAVHGNAHFRGRLIGDQIAAVGLVSRDGRFSDVSREAMEFAYDDCRLHRTGEIVIWAEFLVGSGDPGRLRDLARQALRFRKETQPLALPSAGCVFQNPDAARDVLPPGVPPSAGALIDLAGLKGSRIGGAVVSPTHANFIVNEGGATAAEIRALIERCRDTVRARFHVTLREEVVFLGEFPDA